MKQLTLIGLLLVQMVIVWSTEVSAQTFLAFKPDNFGGATSMAYNPAMIADSRLKFDMEFLGVGASLQNNWFQLKSDGLFKISEIMDSAYRANYLSFIDNDKPKDFLLDADVRLLNFMVTLDRKSALGFSIKVREMMNVNNFSDEAADIFTESIDLNSTVGKQMTFQNMSQQAISWAEYGLTYSRVIYNKDAHFIKGGVSAKFLQGMAAIYIYEKDISFKVKNTDTAENVVGDFGFGASSSLEDLAQFKFTAKPALGFDFGMVYEYRPKYNDYLYDMDGQKNLERRDLNKYLLRFSFSVLDMGSMQFKKDFGSNDFFVQEPLLAFDHIKVTSVEALSDSINARGYVVGTDPYFKFKLPTTINADIDWNVIKNLYINAGYTFALNQGYKHYSKGHYYNTFTMVPRWESKFFAISLPMRMNYVSGFNMGIGLRVGPLMVGSNSLLALTGLQEQITSSDVYVALRIPILYNEPKDMDGDGVSDEMDQCPQDKGSFEAKGCPDSDSDGIINVKDECPYTKGLAQFGGCPDTDLDGVPDKIDKCPNLAGSKLSAGCPDTDGDGITDPDDLCPTLAGTISAKGCPDADTDGLTDSIDFCPTVAGVDSLHGCPFIDSDKDGVQDIDDYCPTLAGLSTNYGCPNADTDNDSVPDVDDLCPKTPGPISNKGCPEIAKEDKEIVNTAFNNLEFETGSYVIISSSNASLDPLAALLIKNTTYRLLIRGYTDNVGSEDDNLQLSRRRAMAVESYLKSKGVPTPQIIAKGYGESNPIADNDTEAGRGKNRRVELMVVFE